MKKDEIMKALEGNMDILPAKKKTVEDADIVHDTETDVEFVRDNLKNLISKSSEALEHLSVIAQETEHPRAFEVVASLMKTLTDANKDLLDIQTKVKKLKQEDGVPSGPNSVTNALFVGSTAELQNMLKDNLDSDT